MSFRSALLSAEIERARAWRALGINSIADKIEEEAAELDDRLAEAEQASEDQT